MRRLMNIRFIFCTIVLMLGASHHSSARSTLEFLTLAERDWLQRHPVIRVGYDSGYAPMDMADSEGQFTGLSSDYLAYFSELLGVEFVAQSRENWALTYKAAVQGQYDMLSAVVLTAKRQKHFSFTEAYVNNRTAVITSRGNRDNYTSLESLKGKVVGVVPDYYLEDELYQAYPDILYKHTRSIAQGLKEVAFGSIDAFVGSIAPVTYYLDEYTITNLAVAGMADFDTQLRFGVRKDWPELVSILNKVIARMPADKRKSIYLKWVSFDDSVGDRYRRMTGLLGLLLLAIVLITALVLGWSLLLKRQVKHRTQQLSELNDSLEALVKQRTQALEAANKKLQASRMALVDSNKALKNMAHYDALTGVANRRGLDDMLSNLQEHLDAQLPLSFLLMDVDLFKAYNDSYGHPKGDECLRLIAQELKLGLQRQGELVARYGGEEFAIVLAHHNSAQALEVAQHKRRQIEKLQIDHQSSSVSDVVTISIGVATLVADSGSIQSLVEKADEALYQAKQQGRNRVVVSPPLLD